MRLVLAASFVLCSACHPTITFDATVQGSTSIPASTLGGVLGALPQFGSLTNVDFSQTQDFQNQGVTKADVQSVKMKSVTILMTSPNNEDFSWLDSMTFSAQAGSMSDTVATKTGINQLGLQPPNPQFSMDVTSVELAPYVTAPSMSLTADATGQSPPQDTTLQATIVITVTANVVK